MSEILYSYSWFKEFCEKEGLCSDSVLVNSEIALAKGVSIEIYKAEKRIENLMETHPEIDWKKKMSSWFKGKHEERISHMLNAVEFAKVSQKQGKVFDLWVKRELQRFRIPEPKI